MLRQLLAVVIVHNGSVCQGHLLRNEYVTYLQELPDVDRAYRTILVW